MTEKPDLNKLYIETQEALKARDYDRAAGLLRQILVEDHEYRDASQLLAKAIRLKRRRWYNDPRVIGGAGILVLAFLLWFFLPVVFEILYDFR